MSKFTPLQIKTLETLTGGTDEARMNGTNSMDVLDLYKGMVELGFIEEKPHPYKNFFQDFFKHIEEKNKE